MADSSFFVGLALGGVSDFSALCVVERFRIEPPGPAGPGAAPGPAPPAPYEYRYDVRSMHRWHSRPTTR
jgi:hypothetical protein